MNKSFFLGAAAAISLVVIANQVVEYFDAKNRQSLNDEYLKRLRAIIDCGDGKYTPEVVDDACGHLVLLQVIGNQGDYEAFLARREASMFLRFLAA